MEKKLADIIKFCSEVNDDNSIYENVKIILRYFIGEGVKSTGDLWFQSDEIKTDTNYYNLVITLIEILYNNLKNKNDFNLNKISNEVEEAIKKTEYVRICEATRKLFFKVEPTEVDYYHLFFGFKKQSPIYQYFISNLKDIKDYEVLSNSPHSEEFENFDYDIMDE